ncbi:NADH-quinone oxidoreductase subunit I, partial [Streptomyces sp. PRKS01-65]|nr:NADH-quinone oxidoreductase subunit I [Streptomyces harenosi]
ALDPGAEEPKELAAARKTADKLAAQRQAEAADSAGTAETAETAARPGSRTVPHADEQARAAERPTRPMGESRQQTDQPEQEGRE